MFLDSLADAAEDNTLLSQFLLEGSLHADGVHDGVDRCISTQSQALLQGNA